VLENIGLKKLELMGGALMFVMKLVMSFGEHLEKE
jgi:hypothetical protein